MSHRIRTDVRLRLFPVVAATFALLVAGSIAVHLRAADGSKGKLRVYDAKVTADQGDWYFKVELEPILFQIVSVQNKYKVLRINIMNRSKKSLQLSLQDDRLQIRYRPADGGSQKAVNGSLDVAHTDRAWWNSLDPSLQKALAYPDQAAIRAGEEENVFVFVPAGDLPSFPDELLFTIKGFSATPIVIRRQAVAMAL
jgi:hypothetical protein